MIQIICNFFAQRTQSPQSAEKLFIHKNFLLSWGLGYAVYIVDVTAFENRNQWPVSRMKTAKRCPAGLHQLALVQKTHLKEGGYT